MTDHEMQVDEERFTLGESVFILKATATSTGGRFTVFEELPPLLDTSMHVHANEDEFYYVLEGDHVFQRGDETVQLGPGGFVFLRAGFRTRTSAWYQRSGGC